MLSKQTRKRKLIAIAIVGVVIVIFFILIAREGSRTSSIIPPNNASSTATTTVSTSTATSTPVASSTPATPTTTTSNILPPIAAANIGHSVGIAAGGELSKMSISDLNDRLAAMQNLGITWVRFDIEWGIVQYSSPTSSNWTSYDTLVNALVAHHMRGLGIIVFTPQWARTATCSNGVECPPADPTTFATFAAEVAARYKADGFHYWEIWNEPNNFNFWAPKTDCNAYTALLKVTYPAIKAADPNAVVVTGGFAPESTDNVNTSPTDFLSCVYNDGGKNYFDAVGDHPYTFPALPSASAAGAWGQMSETTPSLRSIMIANGDASKKIWITEYGTPTDGPDPNWYVSEAVQAQMVTNAFQLYKTYPWAGPFFWYTLRDSGNTTSSNENFFGLTRYDGSVKPAYTTLKNIIAAGGL